MLKTKEKMTGLAGSDKGEGTEFSLVESNCKEENRNEARKHKEHDGKNNRRKEKTEPKLDFFRIR